VPQPNENWITQPAILCGETVDLVALQKEHFPDLISLAGDPRIWEFYSYNGANPAKMEEVLDNALGDRLRGTQFPFVIIHKGDNKIAGSTRFTEIQPAHRKLEIGMTWLHPDYWATKTNVECKLLLLTHAFEQMEAVRVQLKTAENNERSRKAIEKIGGKYEGLLRNEMLREDGSKRNSLYFSIIDTEWGELKPHLQELYQSKKR